MVRPIKRFQPDDVMAEVVAEVRRHGVAIIEDLIPEGVIDGLRAKLEPPLAEQEPGGGNFFGNRKRSVYAIFGRGEEFSEHLLLNEQLLEVADGILLPRYPMASSAVKPEREPGWEDMFVRAPPRVGPNCHHYRINASVAMQVCKGGINQTLHRDEWRYLPYLHRDPEGPEYTVAFMVAITDFTEENGATRFVPGSNNWDQQRRPQEEEVVQAVMGKGSVAVWLGSVFHGLGINTMDEPRLGVIFSHAVDHMTQEENQFMAVPPDKAFKLPKRAQQLIGYRSSPGLNYIEGLEDNHVLNA